MYQNKAEKSILGKQGGKERSEGSQIADVAVHFICMTLYVCQWILWYFDTFSANHKQVIGTIVGCLWSMGRFLAFRIPQSLSIFAALSVSLN